MEGATNKIRHGATSLQEMGGKKREVWRERDLFYTNTGTWRIHCIHRDGGLAPDQHRLLRGHKLESWGRHEGRKRRVTGRKAFSRRSENLHGGSVACSSSVSELRARVSDENLK